MSEIYLRRFLCATFIVACAVTLFTSHIAARDAETFQVVVENGVRVKMRDSVVLVADVYRPLSDQTFPVLLERTPYNRAEESSLAFYLAAQGYIVVLQDTRGRYASEGEFYPFRDEAQDGYDTVEWAAQLKYANGRVGMFGGSYVGATQMLAAMAHPPHLVAIFPFVTASEFYDGWTYQSGVLMQWFTSSWSSILAVDTLRRRAEPSTQPNEWVNLLPVDSYPVLKPSLTGLAPYFHDWLEHESDDAYWQRWRVSDHYRDISVKGLHAGGWHDIFLKGSLKNYTGLRKEAATPEARQNQRLIIGPWAHGEMSGQGKVGDVVFGTNAVFDLTGLALHWFNYALKGERNEYAGGTPVRLFIMGDNVWRDEQEFPLARTRYTKYYLESDNANGNRGQLSLTPPKSEQAGWFEYDPTNPVPTIGGRLCCGTTLSSGPFDQRPNESRRDVLIYSTPPLEKDFELTGFITVELFAATSVVDTDFTALLADVESGGYARYLTDGIVRASKRNSTAQPEPVVPGKVYKYTIDLWATSNVFKAGHRMRLYISSSNFPRFNRNLNTGESILGATRLIKARQTIYHGGKYASAVILPVIPKH